MSKFTVKVKQFEYRDALDPTLYRIDWFAVVRDGKQRVYQSMGYPYATEAMNAAETWLSIQKGSGLQ
jgi:hypothetical protein